MATQNKMVNYVALIAVAIFSFVAMILVLTTDFGWQDYGEYYSTYWFWLGSPNVDAWPQFFLVVIALVFLLSLGYSILLLLINLEKISLNIPTKLHAILGLVLTFVAFITTLFTLGMWAIASSDYYWGVATSFYTSLFGSIIIGICYIVYLVNTRKELTD
ncbi:MAG: hypothetical protein ACTSQK_02800 [Candidatus Heimdallarchaeota archaeon]